MNLSKVLRAELKAERDRLLNAIAAIDLMLEAGGEELPPAVASNGRRKAERIIGQEEQVLAILSEANRAMSIREITRKMPARFKSEEHKAGLRARVGAACSRMGRKGQVVRRGKAVYEVVVPRERG